MDFYLKNYKITSAKWVSQNNFIVPSFIVQNTTTSKLLVTKNFLKNVEQNVTISVRCKVSRIRNSVAAAYHLATTLLATYLGANPNRNRLYTIFHKFASSFL